MNVERDNGEPSKTPPLEIVLSIGEIELPMTFEDLNASILLAMVKSLVGVETALGELIFDAHGEQKIYLISYRNRLNKLLVDVRIIQELLGRTLQNSPKGFIEGKLKTVKTSLTSLQNDLGSHFNSTREEQ